MRTNTLFLSGTILFSSVWAGALPTAIRSAVGAGLMTSHESQYGGTQYGDDLEHEGWLPIVPDNQLAAAEKVKQIRELAAALRASMGEDRLRKLDYDQWNAVEMTLKIRPDRATAELFLGDWSDDVGGGYKIKTVVDFPAAELLKSFSPKSSWGYSIFTDPARHVDVDSLCVRCAVAMARRQIKKEDDQRAAAKARMDKTAQGLSATAPTW
jgi:hypothetical protein